MALAEGNEFYLILDEYIDYNYEEYSQEREYRVYQQSSSPVPLTSRIPEEPEIGHDQAPSEQGSSRTASVAASVAIDEEESASDHAASEQGSLPCVPVAITEQIRIICEIFRDEPVLCQHLDKAKNLRLRFSDFEAESIPNTEAGIQEILGFSQGASKMIIRVVKENLEAKGHLRT